MHRHARHPERKDAGDCRKYAERHPLKRLQSVGQSRQRVRHGQKACDNDHDDEHVQRSHGRWHAGEPREQTSRIRGYRYRHLWPLMSVAPDDLVPVGRAIIAPDDLLACGIEDLIAPDDLLVCDALRDVPPDDLVARRSRYLAIQTKQIQIDRAAASRGRPRRAARSTRLKILMPVC